MKKKLAVLLAIVLIVGLSIKGVTSQNVSYAREAQMYIEVPDTIKKGNEFKVKVVLNSDVALYSIDAYLSYDAKRLEFVPDSDIVTGAEGILELKDSYGEETESANYEITFKALDTGTAEIALTEVFLIDYADLDYIEVTPSAKRFEIGMNEALESDAELSELLVAPGVLTEEFHPEQSEYEMHVEFDVEMIGVTAVPMQEGSIVELDMPEKLQVGENIVTITVTALSGNTKVYTVKVFREGIAEDATEALTEESSSEEELLVSDVLDTETSEGQLPVEEQISETSASVEMDTNINNTEQTVEVISEIE